jgi:hypothetical protein
MTRPSVLTLLALLALVSQHLSIAQPVGASQQQNNTGSGVEFGPISKPVGSNKDLPSNKFTERTPLDFENVIL